MKNKIKRFAKGDFHIPQPEIIFPETHITMRVGEGEKYEGSFSLQNEGEGTIRGLVYPSSYRVQCAEQGFDGNPVNNPGLRPNLQFNITSPSGKVIKHPANGWRWSKETIAEKLKTGELRFSEDETRLIRRTYLADMEGLRGHVFNLGHGVTPAAKLECIEALVETVRERRGAA